MAGQRRQGLCNLGASTSPGALTCPLGRLEPLMPLVTFAGFPSQRAAVGPPLPSCERAGGPASPSATPGPRLLGPIETPQQAAKERGG